jgi:hypothetical protein
MKSQIEKDIDYWSFQRLNLWYKDTVDRYDTGGICPQVILSNLMLHLITALAQLTIIGKLPPDLVMKVFTEIIEEMRQKQ